MADLSGYDAYSEEELINKIAGANFVLGQISGMEDVANGLKNAAGEAFSNGSDNTAYALRAIESALKKRIAEKRSYYDKTEKERRELAWQELARRGIVK